MTPMGKDKVYKIWWLVDECKSTEYSTDVELNDEFGIVILKGKKTKVEIYVFDINIRKRMDYKLSIQAPNIILEMSTNNINDIIADVNRYAKGWRK